MVSCLDVVIPHRFNKSQWDWLEPSYRLLPFKDCAQKFKKSFELGRSLGWTVRTSNPGKQKEFLDFFQSTALPFRGFDFEDVREIDSVDPRAVVIHKASFAADRTLVEDASLDLQGPGPNVGVNLKWYVHRIGDFGGRKAVLVTYLAFRDLGVIFVFKSSVQGFLLREGRGPEIKGFQLNRFFVPLGKKHTLAEDLQNEWNPRFLAMKNFQKGDLDSCSEPMTGWHGAWQAK